MRLYNKGMQRDTPFLGRPMAQRPLFLAFSVLALGLVSFITQASEAAQTGLDLPQPNGCYPVGLKTLLLTDTSRNRDLVVTFWYPATDGTFPFVPYMDKKTAAALAEEWKLQLGFERQVHTHSRTLALIAQRGPFPVVFLEHGTGVVPSVYTVLAEGLASMGFVVVAINHTPDSLISVFPDGHEVRFKPYWPNDADRRTQGEAIGKFAEAVLVRDVRFVLDKLGETQSQDDFWRGQLDLSSVGIVGHSMGGTTAALATKEDPRILAGVNLDGSTYPGMNADIRPVEVRKPLLFIMTEEHDSNPNVRVREYAGSKSNTYYVVISGTDHMSFTDSPLILSRFARDSKADDSAFERAVLTSTLTRSLVEEFFRKYLKGDGAPHLDVITHVDRK
jgi:predicted dienelactone hydrolase